MRKKGNPLGWLLSATLSSMVLAAIAVWLFRRYLPQQLLGRRGR